MEEVEMDEAQFADPGPAYRGVALWMLNDRLEAGEIARQLAGFKAAGWGAVITRTFNGLCTPYLSDAWMAILEQIVVHAAELDLEVWFQAGYMPSAVPDLPPELAHRVIARLPTNQAPAENERVLVRDGDDVYVERRIDHVIDLLNAQAVEAYLERAYSAPWLGRFGPHFGKTISAIWVDEPHFRPPLLPWSEALPERYRALWGSELDNQIPLLFGPGRGEEIRHRYWRVVVEMLEEGYFAPVREWCEQHGVRFSGHLMGEDTLNSQVAWTGAAMPCYPYMGVPGIDHLTKSLTWPSGRKFVLPPKQCASAANQLGQPLVLSEMYAVSTQGLTFADRKQIAAWLMALGINYRCYHGAFYSMRGRRKRIYPPHLSYQQPWWEENRYVADPFARLSYALQQGTHHPEVLILHPVESAFCLYDPTAIREPHDRVHEPADVQGLDAALVDLCDHLLSIQRAFDLGDEGLLASHGEVVDGRVQVGEMRYDIVILPEMITIRSTTVDLLQRFATAGGTILAAGRLPERVDGAHDPRAPSLAPIVRRVRNEPAALAAALAEVLPPQIELEPVEGGDTSAVWVHPRDLPEGKLYYLHNTNRAAAVRAVVWIEGMGRLERWDLESGQVQPLPQRVEGARTATALELAPLGAALLVLRHGKAPSTAKQQVARVVEEVPVLAQPRITRHDPNALTLDTARYRTDGAAWSEVLPVLTIAEILTRQGYEGPVSLQFTFQAEDVPGKVHLVIEDAAEYEVVVNGQPACYAGLPYWIDRSFHPIDVTGLVQAGENAIELRRTFVPLPQAQFSLAGLFETLEGVELESVYLTGDFSVQGALSSGEPQPRCVRMCPGFALAAEHETTSGDLIAGGYPFYAGRVTLSETAALRAPRPGERAYLELPTIDAAAVAQVDVNGVRAGTIAWAPYEVEVTERLRDGENEIAVTLVGTLRNLLGPHHRPEGEPDQCWTQDYILDPDWLDDEAHLQAHWTEDYFLLQFGMPGGARVRYVSFEGGEGEIK
jgi:hypothetical protein